MKSYIFVMMLVAMRLFACTGVLILSEDQVAVSGRTLEFGVELDMSVAVVPRNFSFEGKTSIGKGMSYTSKYAATGVYCFDEPVLMDGVNEKGLVAAAFYFPGYANYVQVTRKNQTNALSPIDFPNWILTQFETVDEVKEGLSSVVIVPTIYADWGPSAPPMHYIVYDRLGRSIVIEPLDQKLIVYENPIGVITNSPTFDWHLTNLGNYINLTPFNIDPIAIRGLKINPFGQGSGMLGLPGDFTPPSRFIRATLFSAMSVAPKDGLGAVEQTFHILNQFDIPLGVIRDEQSEKIVYDATLMTSVKNSATLEYFYTSYNNPTVEFVDLKQFDLNAKEIKSKKIEGKGQKENVSSKLK